MSIYSQDDIGHPTNFDFYLFRDDSPLIMGLVVIKYSDTDNIGSEKLTRMKRPTDRPERPRPEELHGLHELK